jgi:hypothetical protein
MAAGKVLYAGYWGGIWAPAPVRVNLIVECPLDTFFTPSCTDVTYLVRSSFRIVNRSSIGLSAEYRLSLTTGLGVLVDNGNPASLSGVTPPLAPEHSFRPPPAALQFPAMEEVDYWNYPAAQDVNYHYFPVGSPAVEDSCGATVIRMLPPTEVSAIEFQARALDDCVELAWHVEGGYGIEGFRLYRRGETGANAPVNPDRLIPREVRTYLDDDICGGETYWYRLGVVRKDNLEESSAEVMVRARVPFLALHQNVPNPFNPTTIISVALPSRTLVLLSVFNVEGVLITTLVHGVLDEGVNRVSWDGKDARGEPVAAGVYVCKLTVEGKVLTRKMLLLK